MMDISNGQFEKLFDTQEGLNPKEMLEQLMEKRAVLICNPQDEEKCLAILAEKEVVPAKVIHETGRSFDGKCILIATESPESITRKEIEDSVEQLRRKLYDQEMRELEKMKMEMMDAPTLEELDNRAYLRQQHKFAIRQSNRFRRRK